MFAAGVDIGAAAGAAAGAATGATCPGNIEALLSHSLIAGAAGVDTGAAAGGAAGGDGEAGDGRRFADRPDRWRAGRMEGERNLLQLAGR